MPKVTVQSLRLSWDAQARSANGKIEAWTKSMHNNPVFAMEQGDVVFAAVALSEACRQVLDLIDYLVVDRRDKGLEPDDEAVVDEVLNFLRQQLIQSTRRLTNRSTSQSVNLMNDGRVQAWGSLLEDLTRRMGI